MTSMQRALYRFKHINSDLNLINSQWKSAWTDDEEENIIKMTRKKHKRILFVKIDAEECPMTVGGKKTIFRC